MNHRPTPIFVSIGFLVAALFSIIAFKNLRTNIPCARPKITVVMIIDQFAYHYLPKANRFLKHGIRTMIGDGMSYTNAHYPHAMPATAVGHAALSTGTYAKEHGMIGNEWWNSRTNQFVACDEDTVEHAAVFNPRGGFYDYGRSAEQVMVDGLSDQFMRAGTPTHPTQAFSISLKSRSCVIPASKLGKALWYDSKTGEFTSSKFYYEQLPEWVVAFNKKYTPRQFTTLEWKMVYEPHSGAYQWCDPLTYEFTANAKPLVGNMLPVHQTAAGKKNPDESWFGRMPQASQLLCDLGKTLIDQYVTRQGPESTLLWVSFSNFDKLGHLFGPDSVESFDLLYHLDKQIGDFITFVENKVGRGNALFILTSDHGVSPIPELMQRKGYKAARRLMHDDMIREMNTIIEEKYGIKNMVVTFKTPQFYLDMKTFEALPQETQQALYTDIKKYLLSNPNIINVWTYNELEKLCFKDTDIQNFFKQQLHPERSGQIIVQVTPFTILTDFGYGTCHRTPYAHDTHVPFIMYWPGVIPARKINQRVWILNAPTTLAHLMRIPQPSAAPLEGLPLQ